MFFLNSNFDKIVLILFAWLTFQAISLFLLLRIKSTAYILANTISVAIFIIPMLFQRVINHSLASSLEILGFGCFILFNTLTLLSVSLIRDKRSYFILTLFLTILCTSMISLPKHHAFSISLLIISFISIIILLHFNNMKSLLYIIGYSLATLIILTGFNTLHVQAASASITIFQFLGLLFGLKKNLQFQGLQLLQGQELNRRLDHTITRLHLSNDNYKSILQEKDKEVFQASRHASLAEVTTGIAHELIQPLTGIKGLAQNMIDDIEYDDYNAAEAKEELEKICTLVNKSSKIIDHIRNFSQKKSLSLQEVDINRAIINAMDLVNIQLRKNHIEVILALDESISDIRGDLIGLEQLLMNLLLNARDAILDKQIVEPENTGTIYIQSYENNNSVYCIVEDNGTGISQDILPQIWSPFFTTKKASTGTGIGLAISKKIIREHNADIHVKTGPGGTAFKISFPV